MLIQRTKPILKVAQNPSTTPYLFVFPKKNKPNMGKGNKMFGFDTREAPQYFGHFELKMYEFYYIKKKCRTAKRHSTHYFLIFNSIMPCFQAST
jgi:hypothetical protein